MSIFLLALICMFKFADLHQYTHDADANKQEHCELCLLVHNKQGSDLFLAPSDNNVSFEAYSFIFSQPIQGITPIYVKTPYSGTFLNKAPPVC